MKPSARSSSQISAAALGLIVLTLFPQASRADSEPEFYSLKDWAPVHTWQLVAIPALAATTIGISTLNTDSPRWTGGILFDDSVRDGLRLKSAVARSHASSISDYLLYGVGTLPFLVDAVILTGVSHKRMDLAWQMFVLDAEAITLTAFVDTSAKRVVGRQRPFVRECETNPTLSDCTSSGANFSFFSGHTAIASTAATLRCLQHLNLHLYGSDFLDGGACAVAVAATVTTGLLRIMSDQHYLTDVLAGAAIGAGAAFLVYSVHVRPSSNAQEPIPLHLNVRRDFIGLSYVSVF